MSLQEAVKSELFIFLARAAMLASAGIGLPVAGFLLSRAVHAIDADHDLNVLHTIQLDHIQTTVMDHVDQLTRTVADHEARLRAVERANRNNDDQRRNNSDQQDNNNSARGPRL